MVGQSFYFGGAGQCPPSALYLPRRPNVLFWQVKQIREKLWPSERTGMHDAVGSLVNT